MSELSNNFSWILLIELIFYLCTDFSFFGLDKSQHILIIRFTNFKLFFLIDKITELLAAMETASFFAFTEFSTDTIFSKAKKIQWTAGPNFLRNRNLNAPKNSSATQTLRRILKLRDGLNNFRAS